MFWLYLHEKSRHCYRLSMCILTKDVSPNSRGKYTKKLELQLFLEDFYQILNDFFARRLVYFWRANLWITANLERNNLWITANLERKNL